MQTPTTTTRDQIGALVITWLIIPGTPTHSKTTGALGPSPAASAARKTFHHGSIGTDRSFSVVPTASSSRPSAVTNRSENTSYGDSAAGSTTTSAPIAVASARRPGEKSLATTVRTPVALSIAITPSPIGPQPIT